VTHQTAQLDNHKQRTKKNRGGSDETTSIFALCRHYSQLNAAINIGDSKEMRAELRRIIRQLQSRATSGDWAEVEKTLADGNV
jgi:hypothetical protein